MQRSLVASPGGAPALACPALGGVTAPCWAGTSQRTAASARWLPGPLGSPLGVRREAEPAISVTQLPTFQATEP